MLRPARCRRSIRSLIAWALSSNPPIPRGCQVLLATVQLIIEAQMRFCWEGVLQRSLSPTTTQALPTLMTSCRTCGHPAPPTATTACATSHMAHRVRDARSVTMRDWLQL